MFGLSYPRWIAIFCLLILANIILYFYSNWGLITVKVKEAPLSKVIKSIEWQGWVKIYTNLSPDTKVTMYVDHVPLAEAMESLAVNVDVPPPPQPPGGADNPRPNRRPDGLGGGPPDGADRPGGGPGGPPGGRGGGFGGGFGGRAAQWNLAFFVAPTSAQVKQQIRDFEAGTSSDDTKVYTYNTPLQLVSTESTTTAADPRLQSWPGVKSLVTPTTTEAPTGVAALLTSQQTPTPPAPTPTPATDAPAADTTPTLQTYLQDFAQSANIWIMAPGSWAPTVAQEPPPNSSIISAVKNLVSSSRGAVTEAVILRAGRGGPRGSGNRGDFAGNDDTWAVRMQNAINGLPADERPDAIAQLNNEIQFRKDIRALPPEQRRQRFAEHNFERMIYGERLSRMSPAKRAEAFKRLVAMRAAAKGQ